MKVPISSIRIGKRLRNEAGDIESLKISIKKLGLLQPILITTEGNLISGFRRLSAAKELGWNEIEANVVEANDELKMLEMEMDENTARKDFEYNELRNGIDKKMKLLNPNIFVRIWRFIKRIFGIR